MPIILDDSYKITNDKYNWILEKYEEVFDRKTKESKGFEWKQIGWYGMNLAPAIKKYINEKIKDSDTLEVKELLVKLDEINKHIEKVVKDQKIEFVYVGKKDKDDE